MNPQEFKSKHYHTLQAGEDNQQQCVHFPIDGLNELVYMHESLMDALLLLSQLENQDYKKDQLQGAIYWLTRLLKESYPLPEIDGLVEWLEGK